MRTHHYLALAIVVNLIIIAAALYWFNRIPVLAPEPVVATTARPPHPPASVSAESARAAAQASLAATHQSASGQGGGRILAGGEPANHRQPIAFHHATPDPKGARAVESEPAAGEPQPVADRP